MFDQHDSKFMIRRVKNLRVSEFSQTILGFIHDNVCYMEIDIKGLLQVLAKTNLLLRHIYREHLHNLARRHSRVIHELISFVFSVGGHKSLARRIQVGPRVE
jgi:hypothetical protein